jgi:hypothetical protein
MVWVIVHVARDVITSVPEALNVDWRAKSEEFGA